MRGWEERRRDKRGRRERAGRTTLRTTLLLLTCVAVAAAAGDCSPPIRVEVYKAAEFSFPLSDTFYLWYYTDQPSTTISVNVWLKHYNTPNAQRVTHKFPNMETSSTPELGWIDFYFDKSSRRMVATGPGLTSHTFQPDHKLGYIALNSNKEMVLVNCSSPSLLAIPTSRFNCIAPTSPATDPSGIIPATTISHPTEGTSPYPPVDKGSMVWVIWLIVVVLLLVLVVTCFVVTCCRWGSLKTDAPAEVRGGCEGGPGPIDCQGQPKHQPPTDPCTEHHTYEEWNENWRTLCRSVSRHDSENSLYSPGPPLP